eukprot:CAMPEP_0202956124 /NCGR_PEP_ID=MMETSP1396-20130829/674_1 /ASSEMBLY_ACC=CAM_ASM_000872 /TAXON_ID= /ORGANISM="Pseudokeronopsis sp., Strain Brazil" /LENGTH=106 /DNA_ID=CAMNT_0049673015 /DNA_START=975 /DNA_END=1294 /DNA_ORIENTATION=-
MYEFMGIGFVLSSVISYLVLIKSYRDALNKLSQMNDLLNNPNARVASGKQAKKILKQIKKEKKKESELTFNPLAALAPATGTGSTICSLDCALSLCTNAVELATDE